MARATKKVVEIISEVELAQYLTDKERLKALNAQVKALKEELSGREETLIAKLQRGAHVVGRIVAKINWELPDCRPAWKAEFEKLAERLGLVAKDEVEAVREVVSANLKPEPNLVVEAPIPTVK